MEEQLISFETAKLARERGFNEECYAYYDLDGEIDSIFTNDNSFVYPLNNFHNWGIDYFNAPTQSLLQKWLREIHNIHIELQYGKINKYYYLIFKNDLCEFSSVISLTYEEALEIGLQETLKLI